jgi:RHS repeat-associated protein
MRVLVDECAPRALKKHLANHGHECRTVQEAGWSGKQNGELLSLAEVAFDVLVTVDTNLLYQQNLAGRRIAIVVLQSPRAPAPNISSTRFGPREHQAWGNRSSWKWYVRSPMRTRTFRERPSCKFDIETGQYYYRARYYDQNAGQFSSEDSIRFKAGINFFSCVFNDPINLIDPKGYAACCASKEEPDIRKRINGVRNFLDQLDATGTIAITGTVSPLAETFCQGFDGEPGSGTSWWPS